VRVDREQRLAEREIEFQKGAVSAYRWRIYGGLQNPWKLRDILDYRERAGAAKESITNAREDIKGLEPIRAEVERLIAEHHSELNETLRTETQLAHALSRSVERETELSLERKQKPPSAHFNIQELKRLEENSIALRDPEMLRFTQQEIESQLGQTQLGLEKLAARALGRAETAQVLMKEIEERIQSFSKHREFIPVIFQGADGQEKTASLHDLQPRSLTDKLSSFLSTKDRFEMNAINQALDERYSNLRSERNSLESFVAGARDIVKNWDYKLLSSDQNLALHADQPKLHPQFTTREIAQIENFAAKQIDPSIRAQFENVVQSSLSAGPVDDFTESLTNAIQAANTTLQVSDPSKLSEDDYLQAARNTLDNVAAKSSAEYGALNESAAAAETEAGSETWAALF
jgi:hypothetical protein